MLRDFEGQYKIELPVEIDRILQVERHEALLWYIEGLFRNPLTIDSKDVGDP